MGESHYTMWSQLCARSEDRKSYWQEAAEGLACELDSAIEVMAKRAWSSADVESMGKWLVLNYGKHKAVMERAEAARAAHIAGLKEALEMARTHRMYAGTGEGAAKSMEESIRARIAELEGQ